MHSPSTCPSIHPSIHPLIHLPVRLCSVHRSAIYLSASLPIHLLTIHVSILPSTHQPSIHPPPPTQPCFYLLSSPAVHSIQMPKATALKMRAQQVSVQTLASQRQTAGNFNPVRQTGRARSTCERHFKVEPTLAQTALKSAPVSGLSCHGGSGRNQRRVSLQVDHKLETWDELVTAFPEWFLRQVCRRAQCPALTV